MASLIPLGQQIFDDRDGNHWVVSKIFYDAATANHTVDLPGGLQNAAVLALSGETAPGVTITQRGADTGVPSGETSDQGTNATQSRVTLDNAGSSGTIFLVSRHVGSAAGL